MESSEFDTSLVNRQSGPEARILVCVKRSGVFLRSTKRRNTRLGLCSQGHSFVSLRITKVCFTAPNWLKVQEKACALAYRITRSIVVETFRFTYVHTHFLLFRIRLPSFPSPYQIPNKIPFQRIKLPFQRVKLPFQRVKLPFQRVKLPEGKITLPKCKNTLPNGKITLPKGKITLPKGKIILPKGKITLPKGKITLPKGKTNLPKGKTTRR